MENNNVDGSWRQTRPLDAKVLTSNGWIRVSDIAVGDTVVDPEGGTSAVTQVSAIRMRAMYCVRFSDGACAESSADHIWSIRLRNHQKAPIHALTTLQMKTRVDTLSRQSRPYIPLVSTLDFVQQELPLDPYVLGSLLGNGCLTSKTVYYTSADAEQLAAVQAGLPDGITLRSGGRGNPYTYGVTQGLKGRTRSPLLAALRELKLMGLGSHEKFVPEIYKFSMAESRLALLRGLMDTDGSARPSEAFFGTTSPWLARDVQFIARSLGGTATISQKPEGTYKHPDGSLRPAKGYYTLYLALSPATNPFLLSRKSGNWSRQWEPSRRITDVEYLGVRASRGFSLDSSSGRYVTDDFIVTTNGSSSPSRATTAIPSFVSKHNLRLIVDSS
jgi:hypothetical protein